MGRLLEIQIRSVWPERKREMKRNRKLKESRQPWKRSTKNSITRTDDKWMSWADRFKLFCHSPIHHNTTLIYGWNACRNESIYMWNNSSGAHANVRSIGWAHSTWSCCINRIEVEQRHSVFICFPFFFFKISSSRFFLLFSFISSFWDAYQWSALYLLLS